MAQGFIKMSNSLEKALREKLGDTFDAELKRVISEYAEMIDRSAAIYLLGIDNGLVQQGKKSITQFTELTDDNSSISFSAGVVRVFMPMEGKMHKSQRILISDSAGNEKILVFWDSKVDDMRNLRLEPGDNITAENAYYRNGEMHAGQYSKIDVDKKNKITQLSHVTDGKCNVAVRLVGDLSVRTYVKNDEEKQMGSGNVADYSGRVRILIWGAAVSRLDMAANGDVLRLHNATFRNGEIHVNEFTDIEINPDGCVVLARPDDIIAGFRGVFAGKMISVTLQGDWLYAVVRTESKDLKVLLLEPAVESVLGGKLSPDISKQVAGQLKLKSLLGQECVFDGFMNDNGVFECTRVRQE